MESRDSTRTAAPGRRPEYVRAPDHLAPSPPVPPPDTAAAATTAEHGGPKGEEPTRYGDWEARGICWDF